MPNEDSQRWWHRPVLALLAGVTLGVFTIAHLWAEGKL